MHLHPLTVNGVEQNFINKLWSSLATLSIDLSFCTKMLKFQIMFMVI